jgi:3-hydroxyisobutyrate dehydrogenase-like beta-hydroxyacid dehydrogenase
MTNALTPAPSGTLAASGAAVTTRDATTPEARLRNVLEDLRACRDEASSATVRSLLQSAVEDLEIAVSPGEF